MICTFFISTTALAEFAPISGDSTQSSDRWSSNGGSTSFELITNLLDELQISISGETRSSGRDMPGELEFQISNNFSMDFWAPGAAWDGFTRGGLEHPGMLSISWPGGNLNSNGFSLRAASADALELVDREGNPLFRLDHIHTMLYPRDEYMTLWNMDMSLTPWLADKMGYPDLGGIVIATAYTHTNIAIPSGVQTDGNDNCTGPNWHDGVNYFTDVELSSLNQIQQVAREPDVRVAIAPSATLRNVGSADVPWFEKFTTEPPDNFGDYPAPYERDQHPFLVWAMYRIVDDIPQQIGKSAVKHAFFTVNTSCSCAGGSILWSADNSPNGQACTDTYGVGNNNNERHLGVRSELPAFTGEWEQCGSMFAPGGTAPGPCDQTVNGLTNDDFERRLVVAEENLETENADYFFEGWYLIRDDINIFNTMAHKPLTPTFGTSWTFPTGSQSQGPAIDSWVAPNTSTDSEAHAVRQTDHGHYSVAVKTTDLGGGQYRYVYAVMNYDFDPRFNRFSISLPEGIAISNIQYLDGDQDGGNDWSSLIENGELTWTAPNTDSSLEWGHMATFVFEADGPPSPGPVELDAEELSLSYSPVVLGPNPGLDFTEGFESP